MRAAQILVVNGIQEALNIIARLFVRPGTPVAIENPCYRGALSTFESYGAEMVPVLVDKDGIRVDQLPERAVSLLYVTPSHQFPTGETLATQRRVELLKWAIRVGAYVVEDDYDSDFRFGKRNLSRHLLEIDRCWPARWLYGRPDRTRRDRH